MNKNYDVVLFDLDHTLWDYHKNADETLGEIFEEFLPVDKNTFPELISTFKDINDKLWADYHMGHITQMEIRTSRFQKFLHYYQLNPEWAEALSREYIERGPRKSHLVPNTNDVLEYLSNRYSLVIVTNGFEATQQVKMECADLHRYFPTVITSEKAGSKKPSPEIFFHAMKLSGNEGKRAIMIGDNVETDIAGARGAGFDAVHYNPDGKEPDGRSTFTISDLIELKDLL